VLPRGGQGGSVNGKDGGVFLEPLTTSTTALAIAPLASGGTISILNDCAF